MRVVVDINVILSAALRSRSVPGEILGKCFDQEIPFVISESTLERAREVLLRDKFRRRISEEDRRGLLLDLRRFAVAIVEPDPEVSGVADDEEDDIVLGTAVEAGAEVLITGDRGLLAVGEYRGVRVMNPRDFLEEWESS